MVFFIGSMVVIQPAGIDCWEVRSSQDEFHWNRRRKRFTFRNISKATDCATPKPNGHSVCCLFICRFPSTHFQFPQINQWFNLKFCPARQSNGFQAQWQAELRKNLIYWKDGFRGSVPRQWGGRANKLIKVESSSTPQPQLAHPELE